jgi:hypothetical protein
MFQESKLGRIVHPHELGQAALDWGFSMNGDPLLPFT